MPLGKGYSKASVSKNIAELIKAGRKPKQAAAIAFSIARDSAKKAGKSTIKLRKNGKSTRVAAIKQMRKRGPIFPPAPQDPRD